MKKSGKLGGYLILAVLIAAFIVCLIGNVNYNRQKRVGVLDAEHFDGRYYDFGDVKVELSIRGGDSGAWLKDSAIDENGNIVTESSVGTIYEPVIINASKNVVSDWKVTIPIHEKMWLNNSWNGNLEIHQSVGQNEKVQVIDLSEYSEYEITLDYFTDHTGAMIPLYEGDYFVYYPDDGVGEKPINPSKTGDINDAFVRIGYIMYIPNKGIDYVADFSGGEFVYQMYASPVKQPWFAVLSLLILIWLLWFIVVTIVEIKEKQLIERQQKQKAHDEEMVRQTMQLIINLIESKDVNTKGHSIRVAELSSEISKAMGFTEEEAKNIYYIGLLHDCGKINIPDSILKNPGHLSDEEYEIMKKHTVYGADVLKDFSSIEDIDIGAKCHHERYDGKGYPMGLKGEEIPFISRIIGVADALDAMNSNRCYRDRLSKDVILSELKNNRGKQFDPAVLDAVLELIDKGVIVIGE